MQAFEVLRQEVESPVLALLDYRLPGGKNGIELLHGLREAYRSDLPVILLTGDTEAERLRYARASGCRLLHKPVSPQELRRAVLEDASPRPLPVSR